MHPAFFAGRITRRLGLTALLHPGWGAFVCWLVWKALSAPMLIASIAPGPRSTDVSCTGDSLLFRSCAPVPQGQGVALIPQIETAGPAKTMAVAAFFADIVQMVGVGLATGAALLIIFSFLTTPTHVLGRDRQLHATGRGISRPTLARRAVHRGAFTRIRSTRAGVGADWRASKASAAELQRKGARLGRWRLTRWGRRWSAERAAGVPEQGLTRPRFYDRWLFRLNDPPTTKAGKKRAAKRAEKTADRKAGPGEYDSDNLPPPPPATPERPPRPNLDPDDGPPAPPVREPASAGSR
jgi:hypothetical protein